MRRRKPILLLVCLFLFIIGQAQVSKTINVPTAGTLSTLLTATELSTITDLTVSGSIDAQDFKTMRDNMPVLAKLDIARTSIADYSGVNGTVTGNIYYRNGEIPAYAFSGKVSLKSIVLPAEISVIEDYAFNGCSGLTGTINFPYSEYYSVNYIGQCAFKNCSGLTGKFKLPTGVSAIHYGTFIGCTGITELIIPSTVYWIDPSPFSGCTGLKKMVSFINDLYSPGYYDPYFVNGLTTSSCILYVPIGKKSTYSAHTQWQKFTNIVEGVAPTVTTQSISNISSTNAIMKGVITDIDPNNTTQYGVVWSTSPTPTIDLASKTSELTQPISGRRYSSTITGLLPNTIYFARTYASNSAGADYGVEVTFKTLDAKILTITTPTVITNKMVDGNTSAVITYLGNLQGVDAADANNVSVTATATYDNANVGISKTITVVYTLTGSAKDKYVAPANYVITNAKISDYVTLSTLSTPTPGCEGSYMDLPYTLVTGTPTQHKITFNAAALNAGIKNIAYHALSTPGTSGVLSFLIPSNVPDGTYQGTLKMNNELNVESPDYPFTFTINVSADNIRTKFNTLVMFDNFSNRFAGYQWYKNDVEIAGATKQFYVDPAGLVGSYSLKLTTTDGSTLYSCPKVLNIPRVNAQVSTFPNPVKENEPSTVQLTGLSDDQLKDTKLSVYNIQGICVYESSVVKEINQFNLPLSGAYIGHVTVVGTDYVFKIIVGK
ncbi:MAG: leucine-rich repeat protein [Paludibacter sp.]|nr:leucine-rich repeat protein [Paludibacter sp.]